MYKYEGIDHRHQNHDSVQSHQLAAVQRFYDKRGEKTTKSCGQGRAHGKEALVGGAKIWMSLSIDQVDASRNR